MPNQLPSDTEQTLDTYGSMLIWGYKRELLTEEWLAKQRNRAIAAIQARQDKAVEEAAVMGAKFGNAAIRQQSIAEPGKTINLDDVRASGIEQALDWARRQHGN